ncbi:DUF7289 family protein [Halarchaeum salinum]|uniref:DUF7305 domain-containing protein n=1 Tax=Halarchaeum salinum TaxID=489912 RepID=A0AAV3SBI7_9EURY
MTRSRGVSEVVGVVLLLGITIATVTATVSIGNAALQQDQDRLTVEQAELQAGAFHRAVSSATDGTSATARFDAAGLHTDVDPQQGWVNVTVRNTSSGDIMWRNVPLGTVRFAQSEPHLVYQGGAVFRVEDGYALVRERPEFSYRNGSLGFAIRTIGGNVTTNGGIILQQGNTTPVYPQAGLTNPVENTEIEITIHSRYYRAWERIFEDAGADAVTDAGRNTTSVTFPTRLEPLGGAITAGTPTSGLTLSGGMSVDSYNSSDPNSMNGRYSRVVSSGGVTLTGGISVNSDLVSGGDVTIKGGSELQGTLRTAGNFTLESGTVAGDGNDNDSRVQGDAYVARNVTIKYGSSFDGDLYYGGNLTEIDDSVIADENIHKQQVSASVVTPRPITEHMSRIITDARASNSNDETLSISNNRLNCTRNVDDDGNDAECNLSHGTYYLDELSMGDDEELRLNTTDGDITLVVDGNVSLAGASTARVLGDGRVNLFTSGDYSMGGSGDVLVGDGSSDSPPATQFWTYLYPNASARLGGGSKYTGVIYGPGPSDGSGARIVPGASGGTAHIHGALVGDVRLVEGGVDIHYDTALQNSIILPPSARKSKYAHIRLDAVNASS